MDGRSGIGWARFALGFFLLAACGDDPTRGASDGGTDGPPPDGDLETDGGDGGEGGSPPAHLDFIRVSGDGHGFVRGANAERFVPFGFNYTTNESTDVSRLVEDFWEAEWDTVLGDLDEMAAMGTTVVRIHPQIMKFMSAVDAPIDAAFDRLEAMAAAAEERGLALDVTGLGAFRESETPDWYDALSEADRWETQANFWRETARRLRGSKAVFCYDLINEPFVPGEPRDPGEWYAGEFGGYRFVQAITLDRGERPAADVAVAWIRHLTAAIREEDPHHLITVGNLPFVGGPFAPDVVAPELDFLSVHVYPETGDLQKALTVVTGYQHGKPVVIEETYVLSCSKAELEWFMLETKPWVAGFIGHYFGVPRDELDSETLTPELFTAMQLDLFAELREELFALAPQPVNVAAYVSTGTEDRLYARTRYDTAYGTFGYVHEPAGWRALSSRADGTVALCSFFNTDTANHELRTDCTDDRGQSLTRVAGWIYTAPGAGRLPLYRYVGSETDDTILTTTRDDAGRMAAGYAYTGRLGFVPAP